jgi:hypothetical protein
LVVTDGIFLFDLDLGLIASSVINSLSSSFPEALLNDPPQSPHLDAQLVDLIPQRLNLATAQEYLRLVVVLCGSELIDHAFVLFELQRRLSELRPKVNNELLES